MSTKQEKINACEANIRLALSKGKTLVTRKKEIQAKISRLNQELVNMDNKAKNLHTYIEQQESSLRKLKGN